MLGWIFGVLSCQIGHEHHEYIIIKQRWGEGGNDYQWRLLGTNRD